MQIETDTIDGDITRVALTGRLDVEGTQLIDLKFTALTATRKGGILVDMSGVSFIASIGMRTLLSNAKALSQRGGQMVLVSPTEMVREVLITAGIDTLIPICDDQEAGLALLRPPAAH